MSETPPVTPDSSPTPQARKPRKKAFILGRVLRLCSKELREILRDRRTIITLVLMPLLVYPLLSLAFNRILFQSISGEEKAVVVLGFLNEEQEREFLELTLRQAEMLRRATKVEESDNISPEQVSPQIPESDLRAAVERGEVDIGVQLSQTPDGGKVGWNLMVRDDSPFAILYAQRFSKRLELINELNLQRVIMSIRRTPAPTMQNKLLTISVPPSSGVSFAAFIPLVLILMTITGAVYPAIDLTAGERERGTMEALIATPVPRLSLLLGKYVAVIFVALLTASVNLLAMTVTIYTGGLQKMVFGETGLTLSMIVQVFGLLALFATFFSSVLLAVTSFARSFKEAQAYLIPLMLISIGPGIMSLIPGVKLTPILAVVPLMNIVLLSRDVFQNQVDPINGLVATFSTAIYSIASLSLAARIFGTDAVLYGSQKGWGDFLRRPNQPVPSPSVANAMAVLAVIFPVFYVGQGLIIQWAAGDIYRLVLAQFAAFFLIFALIPTSAALYSRISLTSGFQLNGFRFAFWPSAVLFAVSLWVICHEIIIISQQLELFSLKDKITSVNEMLGKVRALPTWLVIGTWALAPALTEEWLFRGYVLGAFRRNFRGWQAILFSSLLFAAFHVVGTNMLMFERFLPSFFMGLFLGWICWKSGSIAPGILLHFLHNGLLFSAALYQEELKQAGFGIQEQSHVPMLWLALSVAGITIASTGVWLASRKQDLNKTVRLS